MSEEEPTKAELWKEMLETENNMRQSIAKSLSMTFFSDDVRAVRHNLEDLLEAHEAMHEAIKGTETKIALANLIGLNSDQQQTELAYVIDAHLALEWFQLTVLDHFHRISGSAAEVKTEELDPNKGGFALDAMVKAFHKIEDPTDFEQQAYLELLRVSGRKN